MKSLIKIFSFLLFFSPLFSQPLYEEQIIPFDGLDDDHFGAAVAVSDSFLFISSLRYSAHTQNSVYVYRIENNSYSFLYKIYPSDIQPGTIGALFGGELLYSDGQLFVGARNKKVNNIPVGAVYLFEYENDSWMEKQIILPPQPNFFGGLFPSFITKFNEYLLIGADHSDSEFENSGKVFLYKFINNKYEIYQELSPFDGKEDQLFGTSGIIKDNTILIGSSYDSTKNGIYSGSVYVYFKEDSLWTFNSKYIPEPNSEFLSLGTSMTANDNYVFIGTTNHPNYNKPGKVYIYNYLEPRLDLDQIIETGDNYFADRFGISLFAKGDSLLVGALFDTVKSDTPGTAYLFVNNGIKWDKKYKISPSNEQDAKLFGFNNIITDDKIFISAHRTEVDNIRPGVVYVYTPEPLSVQENNTLEPEEFFISQNYPNPFNPTTRIDYSIQNDGLVKLRVYDILGNEVATLVNERKTSGNYSVEFSAKGGSASGGNAYELPSGIYFYKLTAGTFTETKKLILLK